MDRPLSTLLYFFVLSAAAASAVANPEAYWHEVLPNTPIPGAIRTLLSPDLLHEVRDAPVNTGMSRRWNYHFAATESQAHNDPNGALFFLEKDLHPNARTSRQLRFIRSAPLAPFIPRSVAGAIPFSSEKLPELMARFSLKPDSAGAEDMRATLHGCEEHYAAPGEAKSCVTSLESMVDFAATNLGTRDVQASSTEVGDELRQKRQFYTVAGVKSMREGGRVIVCHVQPAPYAVFLCHATDSTTRAYEVQLVGEDDGSKVAAVAVCHIDTSAWNPQHLAFLVLKVKPGSTPICHFLRQDIVVWTPSST